MAAHAYWRLRFTKHLAGGFIWLEEVSFRNASDTDLSVGGTALSSGDQNASFTKEMAFDKIDTTGGWSSGGGSVPSWIGYQHPTPVDVTSVVVQVPNSGSPLDDQPVPEGTFLEWSDNGVHWFPEGGTMTISSGNFSAMGNIVRLVPGPVIGSRSFPTYGGRISSPNGWGQALRGRQSSPQKSVWYDLRYGGPYKVVGTTKRKALPTNLSVSRRVILVDQTNYFVVAETWSVPGTGYYEFLRIAQGKYMVISFDHTLEQNGVIATNVPLELM